MIQMMLLFVFILTFLQAVVPTVSLRYVGTGLVLKVLEMEWLFNAKKNINRCLTQRRDAGYRPQQWTSRRI